MFWNLACITNDFKKGRQAKWKTIYSITSYYPGTTTYSKNTKDFSFSFFPERNQQEVRNTLLCKDYFCFPHSLPHSLCLPEKKTSRFSQSNNRKIIVTMPLYLQALLLPEMSKLKDTCHLTTTHSTS